MLKSSILERSIPEPNSGCWIWLGHLDRRGYATIHAKNNRTHFVHRLSYEAFKGRKIPAGLEIDHLCRVPCCVNPDHLEAVSKKTNILRGVSFSAVNAAKTECVNGHPFSGDNLSVTPAGRRFCRACWRERTAAYRQRKASSA